MKRHVDLELPQQRLWTRQEYERAGELGLFGPDECLELIEGVIVCKVTQNSPHAVGIQLTEDVLRAALPGHAYRVQMPLALGDMSEPEPDVAVVPGSARDYIAGHPQTAVLVVEVADTSLAVDRTTKAALYARAGIAEYWILNLPDRLLEVHRDPALMTEQPLGHQYRTVLRLSAEQSVSPLAAPEAVIRVSEVLP